ncbi:hypothetical protein F4703DRAFT_1925656 [Phycomyces blakesleeanus]
MDNFKRVSAIAIVVSTLVAAPLVQGAYLPQSSWDSAAHSDSLQKRALSDKIPDLSRDTQSTDNDELDQNETEGSAIAEDGAPHTRPPYDQSKDGYSYHSTKNELQQNQQPQQQRQEEPTKPTIEFQLHAGRPEFTTENSAEENIEAAVKYTNNEESLVADRTKEREYDTENGNGNENDNEDGVIPFSNEQTAYYDNEVFDDMPEDLMDAEDVSSNRASTDTKLAIVSDRDELESPGLGYAVNRLPIPAPGSDSYSSSSGAGASADADAAHAFDIDQNDVDAADLGSLAALSFLSQPEREEIRTLIKSQEEEAVQELEHEIAETLTRAVYAMSKSRPAPWTDDPIELYQAYTRPIAIQSPTTDTKQRALGLSGSAKQKGGRTSTSNTRFSKGPQEYPLAAIIIILCLLIWVILKVPSLKKLVHSCVDPEKSSLPFHHSAKTKTKTMD